MTYFRNNSKGPRQIILKNRTTVLIEPGETKEVDGDQVTRGIPDGLEEVDADGDAIASEEGSIDPNGQDLPLQTQPGPGDDADGEPEGGEGDDADDASADGEDGEDGERMDPDGQDLPVQDPPGDDQPEDLPSLDGMKKDELEAQAKKEGLDLEQIKGTGKNGHVKASDIEAAIKAKRAA